MAKTQQGLFHVPFYSHHFKQQTQKKTHIMFRTWLT